MATIGTKKRFFSNEYDQLLVDIDEALEKLQQQSLVINFRIIEERRTFLNTLIEVKKKYQAVESFLTGKYIKKVTLPKLPKYLDKPINSKQMEAWILKLRNNVKKYLGQDGNNPSKELNFIKDQYPLLDIVIKVLNGDAFFIGCQQSVEN